MLSLYIGVYLFILAVLWGFFFIAKQHAYKFQHFSKNIKKVTSILFIFLLSLSILGAILIFFIDAGTREVRIDTNQRIQKINY